MTTEELILKAATKVFLSKGYAAARMDEIAKEAGINRALLHYYFRSKEKMFSIIFEEKFRAFFSGVFGIISSDASIFEKVERLVKMELDMLAKNPDLPLFIISEINQHPENIFALMQNGNGAVVKIFKQLDTQLQKEHEQGIIRKISALSFMMNLMGMCVYPFVAKNLLMQVTGLNEESLIEIAGGRASEITEIIIAGLKA